MVDKDHALTTTVATDTNTWSPPGSPIPAPISELIPMPVPKQFSSSTSGQGIETPPTVSDHAVLTIVVDSLLITGYLAHVFDYP